MTDLLGDALRAQLESDRLTVVAPPVGVVLARARRRQRRRV
ncbi:MAG: hypothetical protein JWO60_2453, partial [Frankiales bacterium]|nr:hypothetical protein [Frankiales bacterium]